MEIDSKRKIILIEFEKLLKFIKGHNTITATLYDYNTHI